MRQVSHMGLFLLLATYRFSFLHLLFSLRVCGCQASKRGPFELHFKTVAEGLGALNWLMIEPNPREMIEHGVGGADYSANKWDGGKGSFF